MTFFILLFILFGSSVIYIFYYSFYFQSFLHSRKLKKSFLKSFKSKVLGIFYKEGYFAMSHRVVFKKEYNSFSNSHKLLFSRCYNLIIFKTFDANWELFFHLVKDGNSYSEIMNIRVFPKKFRIKSEGNVEKNYSRLNVFTNNRYLTSILESQITLDYLKWLIRKNGDILLISNNSLHFKAFLNSSRLTSDRVMDMVKALNGIKNEIYKEGVLEY